MNRQQMSTRSGRLVKPTSKMAELMLMKQIEEDIVKTQLEITATENELLKMTGIHANRSNTVNKSEHYETTPLTENAAIGYQPMHQSTPISAALASLNVMPQVSTLTPVTFSTTKSLAATSNLIPQASTSNWVPPAATSNLIQPAATSNFISPSANPSSNTNAVFEPPAKLHAHHATTAVVPNTLSSATAVPHAAMPPATIVNPLQVPTAQDLSDLCSKINLPRLEPEIFSGSRVDFPLWLKSFESLIERNTISPTERLYFLSKYTAGEAKETIKGYFMQDTEYAYIDAKKHLQTRYGDKYSAAETFKEKLHSWPVVKGGDGKGLRKLADYLWQCNSAMVSLQHLSTLNSADENKKILIKLPQYIRDRWARTVDRYLYGENGTGDYPSFGVFCKFIDDEARVANGPSVNTVNHTVKSTYRKPTAVAYRNEAEVDGAKTEKHCNLCSLTHWIQECDKFKQLNLQERRKHASKKGLCFNCLRRGHLRAECKRKGKPMIYEGLQNAQTTQITQTTQTESSTASPTITQSHEARSHRTDVGTECKVYTPVVKVTIHHPDQPHRKTETYAMLDTQSNSCFISSQLAEEINAPSTPVNLKLTTLLKKQTVKSDVVRGLVIKGLREKTELTLPNTYTRETIPGSDHLIPSPDLLGQWPHLHQVAEQIDYDKSLKVGLLIGANCSSALLPKEVRAGKDSEPFAIRTTIGWAVTGGHDATCMPFSFRTQAQEVHHDQMLQGEFYKNDDDDGKMSFEDHKFIKIATEGIQQKTDGHYQLPLPFKNGEPLLPNNRILAERRLSGLLKKMDKSKEYKDDYENFMNKMIANGYAEKVTSTPVDGRVWYIPHHGVYNPRKPGKIRIVFDCSAEFKGEVLNNYLMTGPDLTNNLAGVLCRFRKEPIALACDIEGMFNQVSVPEEQRDYLRFLWLENNVIQEYRMTVHLFGAASSPGCVNFALKWAADEYETKYGTAAADFIRNEFYVDDGLTSVTTVDGARQMIENSRQLCERAGFNLHKFASSNKEVIDSIPRECRDKEFQSIDLSHDSLPVARTLGVEWCTKEDVFKITYTQTVKKEGSSITRRSILSSVSSLFDPLGFISPVLLAGRLILRDVCKDGKGWDEPVGTETENEWLAWIQNLEELNDLKVTRCFKEGLNDVVSVEMHHFSDASLQGYGQCSYVRLRDSSGSITTSLVMSKSRVAPSKPTTVPRLELMAAALSVKVAKFLEKEMHYTNMKHVFWCDSKVVLGYIKNESRRFHMFVSNRVQQIRQFSKPTQWNYVDTKSNPADMTSRGVKTSDLVQSELWWHGPDFLSQQQPLPLDDSTHTVDDDPEVKKVQALKTETTAEVEFDLISRLARFSSWQRAKSAVALCLRLQRRYRERIKVHGPLSVEELQEAERVIVREIQKREFPEIKILHSTNDHNTRSDEKIRKKKVKINSKHSLHKLDPFIDEHGLLRVGGRMKRGSYEETHQVILPKKGHITDLVIRHFHEQTLHAGRNRTLHEIRRQGFWILRARSKVSSLLNNCVTCKRLRGKVTLQKMADLPDDRTAEAPPFTYSGVDLFGPFYVREGRSDKKRWGVLFTCMSTRAVHIEVAHSLTTHSFLNAYRRFVCRRGPIRTLRSDRGTNFIGAKNELQTAMQELDTEMIKRKLAQDNCDFFEFNFNVPHASHMGGCWERMIQTTRNSLAAILIQHPGLLDDEGLQTFMIEAEAVVNSRPLTLIGSVEDGESISPMQLLTLKSAVVLPLPGVFSREDVYSRKRWRRVQYLANQFWTKWKRDFLPSLQERSKWTKEYPNLEVNDIVLILDDTSPRSQWPKGKIVEVFPSQDGQVRKVKVKTQDSYLDRPIQKLVLLMRPGNPDEEP